MQSTPRGLRRHIAIFGNANAGKSTLFNRLIGQEDAIVSAQAGTTTDPVLKSIELLPYGPVTLIDTAGLDDDTALGKQRVEKAKAMARRADVGLFVRDASTMEEPGESTFFRGARLTVFTKCDLIPAHRLKALKVRYADAAFLSQDSEEDLEELRRMLIRVLQSLDDEVDETMIGDLLPAGSSVILVVPVDSEAPKGRLILPQVQLIRDCLDHGIKAYVTRETELADALEDLKQVDLVVTDSQAFALVSQIVPQEIPLTSFSMLLARQKGDFAQYLDGLYAIPNLADGDRVLILEGCTHNHTHEDIGRVKIPKLLEKNTGKKLEFDFFAGYDMPADLGRYSLAVLCGSCMINQAEVLSRLQLLMDRGVPATNYGVILAYLTGILARCRTFFEG